MQKYDDVPDGVLDMHEFAALVRDIEAAAQPATLELSVAAAAAVPAALPAVEGIAAPASELKQPFCRSPKKHAAPSELPPPPPLLLELPSLQLSPARAQPPAGRMWDASLDDSPLRPGCNGRCSSHGASPVALLSAREAGSQSWVPSGIRQSQPPEEKRWTTLDGPQRPPADATFGRQAGGGASWQLKMVAISPRQFGPRHARVLKNEEGGDATPRAAAGTRNPRLWLTPALTASNAHSDLLLKGNAPHDSGLIKRGPEKGRHVTEVLD